MSSSSESNNGSGLDDSMSSSSHEDEPMAVYGGVFQPYQHEPLASSTDESDEEGGEQDDGRHDDDRPEDEDGIRPSQLRDRFEGEIALNQW